jgi:hypothetical protein
MLIKWLKKKVAQWARESWENEKQKNEVEIQVAVPRDVDHNTMPKMRIGVIEALNGRILEVSTAIPNNHNHYDWKTEMYVVPEDQKLSAAVSTVMLMKGLEK